MTTSTDKLGEAIADAIAGVNAIAVGLSPAIAMGNLYQTMAFNTGMQSMNTVFALQQAFVAQNNATFKSIMKMYEAQQPTQ